VIPFPKYPGLSPLFLDFLGGLPEFYPDRPSLDAAAERGRSLLASGARARVPASTFRHRGGEAARMAEELAAGRAVAVSAGHQVGLFTGPLFTLVKAFDAIRLARELARRGVPAVPVFWALTDDHDLQEIARTARPSAEGAEVLVLEGADRQNRQPVGALTIPEGVRSIVDVFRQDAKGGGAEAILEAFARRSAPGVSYGDAFIETLLDLTAPDPLLVLHALAPEARPATVELFLSAAGKAGALSAALRETEQKLRRAGKAVPAPVPEGFCFFLIDREGRRRVEDVPAAAARVRAGDGFPSADVITRPALKSYLFPMAASVLGGAEIAYHAQSLPIFAVLGVTPPVLLPRTHVVLRGPAERRLAESLGLAEEDLLAAAAGPDRAHVPEADAVAAISESAGQALTRLSPALEKLDATLSGALDTARRKIAHQFEQLAERARKAAERRDDVASGRRKRLERLLMPGGIPAERVFSPLSPMLAHGDGVREALRRAVEGDSTRGAAVVDLAIDPARGVDAG
jgi:bacillithiol synthase